MNKFMENLREETSKTETLNGDLAYETTLNNVLDFFFSSGALRGEKETYLNNFIKAFGENKTLAKKALFYSRDILQGQGERENFKFVISYLAKKYPNEIKDLLELIPEYGRWDDIIFLIQEDVDDEIKNKVITIIKDQLSEDIKNSKEKKGISLLAKWLPSENTSSKNTRNLARNVIKALDKSPKTYRKTLSYLRNYLDVVEVKLSKKKYKDIEYSKVPSKAMHKYDCAFLMNDNRRFKNYLNRVESGKEKINSKTLTPNDIVYDIIYKGRDSKASSLQWDSLPNFIPEDGENSIVVADTSGSMFGIPLSVSIGLAMYIAERNKGPFKDYFITFSKTPKVQKIVGNDIYEKVRNLSEADWDMNTDLIRVFGKILSKALEDNASQDELPKKVYIISDMQFDDCASYGKSSFKRIKAQYKEYGYSIPEIVFWNVNSYSNVPVSKNEDGVYLISGYSPSILKTVMNFSEGGMMELMNKTLLAERYEKIS